MENVKINIQDENIDLRCQEYIQKQEKIRNTIDKHNKGWTKENTLVVNYWINYISYCCLIYHFYSFKVKRIENYWSWLIIVFSTFASTLSLFQYGDDERNINLEILVKISITIFTLFTTLISAWMKKQNYVENISELSKYSLKINELKGNVSSILREPIKNRISYKEFIDLYKDNIINCISVRPLISPNDWKETIYIISRYYPELAAYEYPWNKIDDYGIHAMKTYKNMKYNGLWNKIKNFYFCKSRCICRESEEKRKLAEDILDKNIKFYKKLPKTDFDCNNFNCNLYSYDSYIYENMKHKPKNIIEV